MARKSQNLVEVQGQAVNENTRTVYLVDEINEETTRNTIISLHALDETSGSITLVLCTSGGYEDEGFALYDVIKSLKNDVIVIGVGKVYSIGPVILAAGDKRILTPMCKFMLHYGNVTLHDALPGNGSESQIDSRTMIAMGKDLELSNQRYLMLMANRSGQPLGTIKDWCEREIFLTASQAVKYGFADEIQKYEGSKI